MTTVWLIIVGIAVAIALLWYIVDAWHQKQKRILHELLCGNEAKETITGRVIGANRTDSKFEDLLKELFAPFYSWALHEDRLEYGMSRCKEKEVYPFNDTDFIHDKDARTILCQRKSDMRQRRELLFKKPSDCNGWFAYISKKSDKPVPVVNIENLNNNIANNYGRGKQYANFNHD